MNTNLEESRRTIQGIVPIHINSDTNQAKKQIIWNPQIHRSKDRSPLKLQIPFEFGLQVEKELNYLEKKG